MKRRMTVILLLVSICLAAGSAGNTVIAETIAAGDTVVFGRYEQDNNMENGPEPIEWIVLNVDDGKALLLTGRADVQYRTRIHQLGTVRHEVMAECGFSECCFYGSRTARDSDNPC